MASHERIEEMLQEEIVKAREAGIPISSSIDPHIEFPKARSFYGMCHHKDTKHSKYDYRIRISEFFAPAPEEEIRQTLMHELIHTISGCHGHDANWRKWAGVANTRYGYQIARLGEYHKFSMDAEAEKYRKNNPTKSRPAAERATIKYKIQCTSCERTWNRTRRSRVTENIDRCLCPYCRIPGSLVLIRL